MDSQWQRLHLLVSSAIESENLGFEGKEVMGIVLVLSEKCWKDSIWII